MFDFTKYAELFNNGDDIKLVETYFTEDFVYTGDRRVIPDRAAFLDFLKFAHDGVREIMRPQLVLQDKDRIFAEIDMDFHALKARQDYPFGELKPGDMITVKFFVIYKLRDGKIAGLKSAVWPRNYGVSKAPGSEAPLANAPPFWPIRVHSAKGKLIFLLDTIPTM
jgi:hypothetical protein